MDGMSKSPWFKFYCSDYLLDEKVSKLSFEAQGILVRIWCGLWIHGTLPSDLDQLSLRVQVPVLLLQKHLQNLLQILSTDVDGFLYSERMDREREHSERISFVRREAVKVRHSKEHPTNVGTKEPTNGNTKWHTKKINQKSEVRSQILESESNTKPFCLESPSEPHKPSVITLPLNDSTEHPIFPEQVSEWAKLYPAVDVMQDLRSMRGWLLAEPRRRKTKNGIHKFVNSWLSRSQDKSRGIQPSTNTNPVRPPDVLSGLEQIRANKAAGLEQMRAREAAAGGYKN